MATKKWPTVQPEQDVSQPKTITKSNIPEYVRKMGGGLGLLAQITNAGIPLKKKPAEVTVEGEGKSQDPGTYTKDDYEKSREEYVKEWETKQKTLLSVIPVQKDHPILLKNRQRHEEKQRLEENKPKENVQLIAPPTVEIAKNENGEVDYRSVLKKAQENKKIQEQNNAELKLAEENQKNKELDKKKRELEEQKMAEEKKKKELEEKKKKEEEEKKEAENKKKEEEKKSQEETKKKEEEAKKLQEEENKKKEEEAKKLQEEENKKKEEEAKKLQEEENKKKETKVVKKPKKSKSKRKIKKSKSKSISSKPLKNETSEKNESTKDNTTEEIKPEVKQEEVKPVEVKQEEIKPEVVEQNEAKPEETKTEEIKPEIKQEEVKPVEVKQEESKPEVAEQEEVKPEEVKQEETKIEVAEQEEVKPEVKQEETKTEEIKPEVKQESKPKEVPIKKPVEQKKTNDSILSLPVDKTQSKRNFVTTNKVSDVLLKRLSFFENITQNFEAPKVIPKSPRVHTTTVKTKSEEVHAPFYNSEKYIANPDKSAGKTQEKGAFFSYEELLKYPVNLIRTQLEAYLSDEEFEKVFLLKRSDFYSLPKWKQIDLKRGVKLF